jgi:hypothetical protein
LRWICWRSCSVMAASGFCDDSCRGRNSSTLGAALWCGTEVVPARRAVTGIVLPPRDHPDQAPQQQCRVQSEKANIQSWAVAVPVHVSAVVARDVRRHLDVELEPWLVQVSRTSVPAARFGGAREPRKDEKVNG